MRANELGLERASDADLMRHAAGNGMIMLTMDIDVGHLLFHTRETQPSAIILRLRNPVPSQVESILQSALPRIEKPLQTGSIVVISESRIRIRKLPLP